MLAVITYNLLFPYTKGIQNINGIEVLFLPETFTPKSPQNIHSSDTNWKLLLQHKDELQKIIIFAGKKSSGALEIIDLECASFYNRKECLFFVLCDHELQEKIDRLKKHSITREQYICFEDGHLPCQEGPILKGYMLDYCQHR